MTISYGGVYLTSGVPAVLQEGGSLALADLYDFVRPTSPGRLSAVGFPYLPRARKPKLNSLWWPNDAARFAVGYFLADDAQIALIRPQAYASNRLNPLPLVISDGVRSITVSLSMLPPRPLASCRTPALWLLTLVDARYFFNGYLGTVANTGTWHSWFASILGQLSPSWIADGINAAYLAPDAAPDSFTLTNSDGLAELLDAGAAAVGQRIIYTLDGTVRSIGVAGSVATMTANQLHTACDGGAGGWAGSGAGTPWPVAAGGFLNANQVIVLPAFSDENTMPGSVNVSFPTKVNGSYNGAEFASLQTLASLAIPQFGSAQGSTAVHQIRLPVPALVTSNPNVPDNSTALAAMAQQAALDYYGWLGNQIADLSFDHVAPWVPCGAEDSIEWTETFTRVQRPPWNERREVVRPTATPPSVIEIVRLDGNPGSTCTYLNGYIQVFDTSGPCVRVSDGEQVDVLDLNQP